MPTITRPIGCCGSGRSLGLAMQKSFLTLSFPRRVVSVSLAAMVGSVILIPAPAPSKCSRKADASCLSRRHTETSTEPGQTLSPACCRTASITHRSPRTTGPWLASWSRVSKLGIGVGAAVRRGKRQGAPATALPRPDSIKTSLPKPSRHPQQVRITRFSCSPTTT